MSLQVLHDWVAVVREAPMQCPGRGLMVRGIARVDMMDGIVVPEYAEAARIHRTTIELGPCQQVGPEELSVTTPDPGRMPYTATH